MLDLPDLWTVNPPQNPNPCPSSSREPEGRNRESKSVVGGMVDERSWENWFHPPPQGAVSSLYGSVCAICCNDCRSFIRVLHHLLATTFSPATLICHCPEGRGREGVGSLVVQLPRIGGDIRQKVENKGEDPGRCGEDGEG